MYASRSQPTGDRLQARAVMAIKTGETKDASGKIVATQDYGILWLSSRTETDKDAREVVSVEPSPESRAQDADFRRLLLEALGELGEPYKSVVILREVQGLPHREIGEALGIPEATVRVHLHRGRRKLRERLREVSPV